jgi:diguanylate cyclase (GGDEF)-like protein
MTENFLYDIVDLCKRLDKMAEGIYHHFHRHYSTSDKELSRFWQQMAKEEKEHIELWEGLLRLVKDGMLPQIFDDPFGTKTELENIRTSVRKLQNTIDSGPPANKGFLVAYKLEFYMLHPTFELLFHFAQDLEELTKLKIPKNNYEKHIDQFIQGLNRYGTVTPEMQLLGETLTRLWKENRKLVLQGNTDTLTQLLNRRGFFQAIKPFAYFAQRNQYHVGILMIDIDHFKEVNDTYGHQRGDQVLAMVARGIESSLRKSDICCRYGGEEFIVFLPMVEPGTSCLIARKIRATVEDLKAGGMPVTVSIGCAAGQIAVGSDVDHSIYRMIQRADEFLFRAKSQGRNRVEFEHDRVKPGTNVTKISV